jgi:hypothetical protein
MTVSGDSYSAAISNFTAPSVRWNWAGNNQVTVSTPSLTLTNVDSGSYNFIDDEFGSYNFLGQSCRVYLGFQNLTGLTDFVKIYDGRIDDIDYTAGAGTLGIRFRSTGIPDATIQTKLFDPSKGLIGSTAVEGLLDETAGKMTPLVFGNHWNAPAIYYKQIDGDTYHACADDISGLSQFYSGGNLPHYWRHNQLMCSRRAYFEDTEKLVGVPAESVMEEDSGLLWDTSTGEGCVRMVCETSNEDMEGAGDGTVSLYTPIRLDPDALDDAEAQGNPSHINSVTGSLGNLFRHPDFGDYSHADNKIVVNYDPQSEVTAESNGYLYTSHSSPSIPLNLWQNLHTRGNEGTQGEPLLPAYTGAYQYPRPIHLPLNDEVIDSVIMAYYSSTWDATEPCLWSRTRVYLPGLADAIGEHSTDYTNVFLFTSPWLERMECRFMGYLPLNDDWDTHPPGGGVGYPLTWNADGMHPISDAVEETPSGEYYDGFLSGREIWENGRIRIYLYFGGTGASAQDVTLHEMLLVHRGRVNVAQTGYTETEGVSCLKADLHSVTGSVGSHTLEKPYEYIEAVLREWGGAASGDFNSTEWESASTWWADLYSTMRDQSGFVLTEPKKLRGFLKDYLEGEAFTVWFDETGTYRITMWEETYSDSPDKTLPYEDLDTLETGLTDLDSIVTDVGTVEVDKVYYNDSFLTSFPYYVSDGSYSFSQYDAENSYDKGRFRKEALSKPFTSMGKASRVEFAGNPGTAYYCKRPHVADSASGYGGTDFDKYWATAGAWTSGAEDWTSGESYAPFSAEADLLAWSYLNMYGNRRRKVKFSTRKMEYYGLQVGDVIAFSGCPYTLLGQEIKGWSGDANPETLVVNGQTAYYHFTVTAVSRTLDGISVEAIQNLKMDLEVSRGVQ